MNSCSINWSKVILKASGVQVKIEGLENLPPTPAVLVGNHQGVFDILALIKDLPTPPVFVAKHSLFKVPLFGPCLKVLGHIPVDRSNRERAIASIRKGTEQLKERGDHVIFFAEGTRTRNGELLAFKKGAFVFALESGLPIVPFTLDGSYQALPPGKKVVNPGTVTVRFLEAIKTEEFTLEQREELTELTYQRIAECLLTMRSSVQKLEV